MDSPDIPVELLLRFHRDLERVHYLLGTYRTVLRFLQKDGQPVGRVLDIGCGGGDLLRYLRRKTGVDVIGVDPRPGPATDVPVLALDGIRDRLPEADVAICTMLNHHLTPEENVALIQNVARSARRFVILDLIRHPLPLVLFTAFLCPLIGPEAGADGRQSIRRAYTPEEFLEIVRRATEGMDACVSVDVSMLRSRQVVDIRFR